MKSNAKTLMKKIFPFAAREPFFIVTLLLTAVLSVFSRPHLSAVHWNVITTLFSLMLICHAFDRCQLLSSLAGYALGVFKTPKKLGLAMIFATGIFSMFVTNDVALLTVVPLTMKIARVSKKDPLMLIVLETISANLFSALTPFGNPQNLYLYSYFKIPVTEFFIIMLPFCLIGIFLLIIAGLVFNSGDAYITEPQAFEIYDYRLLAGSLTAFVINILSVFRIIDYRAAFIITLAVILMLSPRLIAKVDYFLLITFILFFLFTDSVTGIHLIRSLFAQVLNTKASVLIMSAGLSQIISNVPASVLLSGFTSDYKDLLYGVSAGGLGTLVASLASLISYKYYVREYKSQKYLKVFSALNFGILIIMVATAILMDVL